MRVDESSEIGYTKRRAQLTIGIGRRSSHAASFGSQASTRVRRCMEY
jgi:hypothetical protein